MMRLVLIVAAVMSGFVFISLVFFRATRKTYPGFGHWTAGGGFLTLGYLALALRGFIPDAPSIFVGNVAFPLGIVLALDGLRRFLGLTPASKVWYATPGGAVAAAAVFYFVYDLASWRVVVNAIAVSAPHWAMAALIFRHRVKHKSMLYCVIGCFLVLSGLVVLVRAGGALLLPQWHLLLDSPFLLGSVIALIVLQLGESLCWMMLNSERLENELAESEADQRLTVDRLQLALAEQKKAEEGLRHSEQKLSMALEGANLAIWEWDLTTGKAVWSERIHKGLGYEPDEFEPTLKNWKEIIHADDWPSVSENLNLHIQGKLPVFEVEYRALNKAGDWHWVYAQGKVIEVDANGKPMRMAGVVADATDRKKAEEALRESEERYRTIVDLSPMGIFVVVDKCFTYVNQSFADILGFTNASDIIGKPAFNFLHPDYHELVEDHIATMLKTGLSVSRTEEKLVRTDGTLVNVEVAAAAIDYDGRRGILVIVSDITKRKQADEQVKQAEEFLNTVVDNLPIAVFAKSAQNGQFILWNKASQVLFGLTREQAIGKTDYDFFPKEQADFFWEKDRESLASGQVIDIPEESIRTKNLGARILHTRKVPVYDTDSQPSCLLGMSQDITDRKNAEEALRKSEALLNSIIEQSPFSMHICDNEGTLIKINPACKKWVRVTDEDVVGKYNLLKDEAIDAQGFMPMVRRVFEHGEQANFELEWDSTLIKHLGHKEAFKLILAVTIFPVKDAEGRITNAVCQHIDITERNRAEEALRESEEKYRILVERAHEGILVTQDALIKFVNPKMAEMVGYSQEELLFKPLAEFIHPDDREMVLQSHFRRLRGEEFPGRYPFRMLTKDGNVRWIENNVASIQWEGKPAVQSFLIDITEQRAAELASKVSEIRYRRLFEAAKDGILILDADAAQVLDVNPFLIQLLGYSHEELLQKKLWEIGILEDTSKSQALFPELQSKEHVRYGDLQLQKKDGSSVEVELVSNVYQVDGENVIQCNIRDVTERKRLEKQLLQSQKMEAVGILAGGVAHDFNNLLTVIQGFSELLIMEMDEKAPGYSDLLKIEESAKRGAELVRNLLAFSRKAEINPRPINLNNEVAQIEKLLSRTIPKMIKIELHLEGNLAVVNADPDQIGQVLMNLTVNAQQAVPDGGNLTIATANICLNEEYCRSYPEMHPGNYVLLTVSDTGRGMDKETLDHIFEPFFTTKGLGKGTGLGLAMVYGIVRQHGGHVTCHSEPNKGATFKIYLPAIEKDRTERKSEEEQALPRGGTETILLVDDEDYVRDLGAKFLTRAGYTVLKAASGPEALELYLRQGNRISLTILDIIMPEMGGDKCLEEILAINPDAKIVISSGAAVEGKTKETLESGARGFVSKPFQLRDMLKTVREVLDES